MRIEKAELDNLDKKFRINLINSISGVKPANLIGTTSKDGIDNLAIFSSVVHLGSSPAQLGMITRPQTDDPKDTYTNILETGYYTINHVSASFIKKAHYTSAKLKREESEFEVMKIKKMIMGDFPAPFVQDSAVKIGLKHLKSIPLPNGCIFIIGEVVLLEYEDNAVSAIGELDLSAYEAVGISGLNSYYALEKITTFPYERNAKIPTFEE